MPVRTVCAAAALAAAAVVGAVCVVRGRHRRLRQAAVAERLLAGRVRDDNAVLARDLEVFRRRLDQALARRATATVPVPAPTGVPAGATPVPCPAFHDCRITPPTGGGPQ